MKSLPGCCTLLMIVLGGGIYCDAATLFAIDDFEDGTVEGWDGGNAPTNIASGGPEGEDDSYLRLTPRGAIGPGGNLASFNLDADWIGNYSAIGANAVKMDLRNPASNVGDLEMRFLLMGPITTSDRWTSSAAYSLPNDGQWHSATFSLLEDDLTRVGGTSNYAAMMNNVLRVLIRYDPGTPSFGGATSDSVLHIDNVVLLGPLPGDKNGDGAVDAADFSAMATNWGTSNTVCDLNGDGIVDGGDAGILFANWTGDSQPRSVPEPLAPTGLACFCVLMMCVLSRRMPS